jgi:hypothetical protein
VPALNGHDLKLTRAPDCPALSAREEEEIPTKWANQQLRAALGTGGEPAEDLLDRALASMENLSEAADTMTRLFDELLKLRV